MSKLQLATAKARISELEQKLKIAEASAKKSVKLLEQARSAKPRKPIKRLSITKTAKTVVEIIVADVHGAHQDPDAVAAFFKDLEVIRPDRIVLLGDILDASGFVNAHDGLWVPDHVESYEDDIKATNMFLDQIDLICPKAEVHYLEGNHEARIERWVVKQKFRHPKDMEFLRRQVSPEHVLHIDKRGYNYIRYLDIQEGFTVGGWLQLDNLSFCHTPPAAGRNSCSSSLAITEGNCVFAHTHRQDYMPSVRQLDGSMKASWNTGCLCKRQPLWQAQRPTNWTHGYLVRFIDRQRDTFQVVPMLIYEGRSLGHSIFGK